jgi:hypothetical protein
LRSASLAEVADATGPAALAAVAVAASVATGITSGGVRVTIASVDCARAIASCAGPLIPAVASTVSREAVSGAVAGALSGASAAASTGGVVRTVASLA